MNLIQKTLDFSSYQLLLKVVEEDFYRVAYWFEGDGNKVEALYDTVEQALENVEYLREDIWDDKEQEEMQKVVKEGKFSWDSPNWREEREVIANSLPEIVFAEIVVLEMTPTIHLVIREN